MDIDEDLAAKSVQSSTLSLQRIDHIHGSDCLSLGMLCVGDCISDDILKKNFEHATGLLVD